MKKQLIILLSLTLLILSLVPLSIATDDANYKIQLIKYEPIPAQPGQYINAYIQITNIGNADGNKVILEMENNFPFQTISKDDEYQELGVIKSQQSLVKTIKFRVSKDAVVGINELKVKLYSDADNLNEWSESILYVDVKPNQASLLINKVSASPEEVSPGKQATIDIELKNTEDITLRDVSVKLELKKIVGTTIADIPLIPLNSATEKQIVKLNPGEKNSVVFKIKTYPTATPGYYKIPLTISFYDDQGEKTVKEEYIGLIIKAEPELEVYLDKNSVNKESLSGSISLKFVNKGINDLKFLDVKILSDDSYDVLNNDQEYIGDLDSDDYRTETFDLKIHKSSVPLKVQVSYKDTNNKDYSFVKEISVTSTETVSKNNSYTSIIILVIVVLVGLFFWFRRKKTKKK